MVRFTSLAASVTHTPQGVPVAQSQSLSVSSAGLPPTLQFWLARVRAKPAGVVKLTVYCPAHSPLNRYLPLESVVVLRSKVSVPGAHPEYKSTCTPWMPGSPASWQPLPLRSFHTKSPIWPPQTVTEQLTVPALPQL